MELKTNLLNVICPLDILDFLADSYPLGGAVVQLGDLTFAFNAAYLLHEAFN